MPRVGNHGLGIEKVPPYPFRKSHAQIGVEANPSYPHTGIILVGGREVGRVVVMVVRVAHMGAGLCLGQRRHCGMPGVMKGIRKRL
jgi:hypothetical protein